MFFPTGFVHGGKPLLECSWDLFARRPLKKLRKIFDPRATPAEIGQARDANHSQMVQMPG